jgi:hypothetical protein
MADQTMLTWDFSLPAHVDAERIVVNNAQLKRILAVGAFRSIHVGEFQGDLTTFVPGINGIDATGTATASRSGVVSHADMHKTSLQDDYRGDTGEMLMPSHGKTRVATLLNKPEIASRVVDRKRDEHMSSEQAWAKEINEALNQSMRSAAKDHLIGREDSQFAKVYSRLFYASFGTFFGQEMATEHYSSWPQTYATVIVFITLFQEMVLHNVESEHTIRDRRYSLTPLSDEQWDRYWATSALTRAVPIVKTLR